jgi:hypothetical protein
MQTLLSKASVAQVVHELAEPAMRLLIYFDVKKQNVYLYTHGRTKKSFSVNKYGVDGAVQAAVDYLRAKVIFMLPSSSMD